MTDVFKVMVPIGTKLVMADAIDHEGAVWLIPKWIRSVAEGWRQPERMIRVAPADLQPFGMHGCRYLVQRPMPAILFETATPLDQPTQVVLSPAIRFPL